MNGKRATNRTPRPLKRGQSKAADRKRSGIIIGAIIVALIAVGAFLVMSNVYVIRNIIVEGDVGLSGDDAARLADIRFGTSLRSIDEEKIRQNIESTGEYVLDQLRVARPDTLILTLSRRVPVAIAFSGGKYLYLDLNGCVAGVSEQMAQEALIFVKGLNPSNYRLGRPVSVSEEQLLCYKEVLRALLEQDAGGLLRELDISDMAGIQADSRIGVSVLLGSVDHIDDKIIWMKAALLDLEQRGDTVGVLDVSSGQQAQWKAS